jgi:hypothetical protein
MLANFRKTFDKLKVCRPRVKVEENIDAVRWLTQNDFFCCCCECRRNKALKRKGEHEMACRSVRYVSVSDTCMILVRHVLDKYKFFFLSVFRHSLNRWPTFTKHSYNLCRLSAQKIIIFLCFYPLSTYLQGLKMRRNNNVDHWQIKEIKFWLHYF